MSISIIAENKKARRNYEILEKIEAGIELRGSEVKSLRDKQCQLKDAYVDVEKGQAFLFNVHISVYKASSYNNHEPERVRRLLLHKNEINWLLGLIQEKGLTCIPLKLYFKKGRAKVELAVARGKKLFDKRETIKKRDVNRELQRGIRR